jgi:hypothetical protein
VRRIFDPPRRRFIIVPVQAESLEVLEKADVPPAQARAIVRAIEIEIAGAKDTLATKHDILLHRQDAHQESAKLRQEMTQLGATLRGEMAELGAALRGEMAELGAALRGEMAELGAALRGEMTGLRTDLARQTATLRGEMSELRGQLQSEIHRSASSITRQMYTALLGQMAVLLGFAYFFATNIA